MPKFRKKPVVIEARPFDGSEQVAHALMEWIGGKVYATTGDGRTSIIIPTLEGDHRADPGDWIIRGVKGEFYPCKPDIFEATYELVSGAE